MEVTVTFISSTLATFTSSFSLVLILSPVSYEIIYYFLYKYSFIVKFLISHEIEHTAFGMGVRFTKSRQKDLPWTFICYYKSQRLGTYQQALHIYQYYFLTVCPLNCQGKNVDSSSVVDPGFKAGLSDQRLWLFPEA